MGASIIVANWKANKTPDEAAAWLQEFKTEGLEGKTVILCPSLVHVPQLHYFITTNHMPLALGVQDISPFDSGAYTGAVSAKQIKPLVSYAIVGHSERRKYFHETNDEVVEKLKRLQDAAIIPILCLSDMGQLEYYLSHDPDLTKNPDACVFVYEPPSAISGGGVYKPEDPSAVSAIAKKMQEKIGSTAAILYGGSINPENAKTFFQLEHISGGLVGQASLDPQTFSAIVHA